MKKTALSAVVFAAVLLSPPARAEEGMRYMPEPAFNSIVNGALRDFEPRDAFAGVEECRIVDAKTIRAFELDEAVAAIRPCLAAVARRYAEGLSAKVGVVSAAAGGRQRVMGILIEPAGAAISIFLVRDLNRSLSLRDGKLLGHPARLSRRPKR